MFRILLGIKDVLFKIIIRLTDIPIKLILSKNYTEKIDQTWISI